MAAERIGDVLSRILPETLTSELSTYEIRDRVVFADGRCLYSDVFYRQAEVAAFQKARELRRDGPRQEGGALRAVGVYRRKKLLKYWEIRLGDEPCKAANPPSAS